MSDSVRPHRQQPTRLPRPWDSPGKNTGVGYFLLQCMKVKSEREVAQSCLTLSDPMDCSLPGSSVHGIFQARVLEWGAIAFSIHVSILTQPPSHPGWHVTLSRVPCAIRKSLLVIRFKYNSVYMTSPKFQTVPSPSATISLFSKSLPVL